MSANMSSPLRPLFFVVRPSDQRMVPLVAMDELPPFVTIQGVPRTLTAIETTGMISVGAYEVRGNQHVVEGVYANKPPNPESRSAPEAQVQQAYPPVSGIPTLSTNVTSPSKAESTATKTTPGTKIYCDHWIATGACSFVQKGCHYKHEMPMTREALAAIGQPDIPAWYRRRYNVTSLNLAPGMTSPSYSINDSRAHHSNNWRNSNNQGGREHNAGSPVRRPFATRGPRGQGRQYNKPVTPTTEDDTEDSRREATAARNLDREAEKRRQAMQSKYKSLAPDRNSVFTHDPEFNSGFDSEAECSSLMSDQDRYDTMSDATFEAEQRNRVRRVHASRSASANASASASEGSSGLSAVREKGQAGQRAGKAGNRRGSRGGRKHGKSSSGTASVDVNAGGAGNGKAPVTDMRKIVADKAVVQ